MPSTRHQAPSTVVPVICGPTSAGKSAVAMWLAERHDITIISADSRQVYRGFDIGTNKPNREEQKRVPHVGIDVADPNERYSAATWCALAREQLHKAQGASFTAVVVGGTGFYISALFEPLWDEPELDPVARAAVQAELDALDTEELRRWCAKLDPARSHLGRTQLLRAVEIALLTGERLSDMHRDRAKPATHVGRYLVIDPGTDLSQRIASRTHAMFELGWVDEVRGLMDVVPPNAPAWNASGYQSVRLHAHGELGRSAAIEEITIETRQYAKRQRTWFRNQLPESEVTRVAPNVPGWETVVEKWFNAFRSPLSANA